MHTILTKKCEKLTIFIDMADIYQVIIIKKYKIV